MESKKPGASPGLREYGVRDAQPETCLSSAFWMVSLGT